MCFIKIYSKFAETDYFGCFEMEIGQYETEKDAFLYDILQCTMVGGVETGTVDMFKIHLYILHTL